LADATKTLLGLEVVSRAINHLPNAAKTFREELGRLSSSEGQALERQVDAHEQRIAQFVEDLSTENSNLSALEDRREAVGRELAANQSSRVLQEKRRAAEKSRQDAEARQDAAKRGMRELISRDGFLPFTASLASTVRERFSDLEERGELPAPIKEPFIRELLDRGVCICGSPVHEGSPTRAELETYLKTAGSPELESLWTRLDGTARRLPDACVGFHANLTRLLKEADSAVRVRQEAIELESEVAKELKGGEDVDVQALEDKHATLLGDINACNQRVGRLQSDLKREQAHHAEAVKAFDKASRDDARSNELKECLRIAREGVSALRAIQSVLTEGVRQQLNERIQATYDKISARPRTPELSSEFELRLWETGPDGRRRRASNSTSENTILALSFVGGLVSLARDLEEDRVDDVALRRLTEGSGGIYPVVVDAAFGSLDETYKIEVARALPKLASQLVIFVSKAQAQDTVDELAARIGRQWVIVSHVAKADRDENIEVRGTEHPYRRVCGSGEEHADLLEIS
jgi:DNA sulfur modification protein DndD